MLFKPERQRRKCWLLGREMVGGGWGGNGKGRPDVQFSTSSWSQEYIADPGVIKCAGISSNPQSADLFKEKITIENNKVRL